MPETARDATAGFRRIVEFDVPSLRCPYAHYEALRAAAPVAWVAELSAYVVTRFDDIVEANRHPEVFSSSAALGPRPLPILLQELFNRRRRREGRAERPVRSPDPVLLSADPPLHTRHRALLSRAFTPRRVALLEARIEALTRELVAALADQGRCEFVAEFAVPLPLTLLAEVLGVPTADLATFKRWSDDFVSPFGAAELDEDRLLALAATAFEFEEYFRARVEERRARPRDDLLTDVVSARVAADGEGEEALTTDEIVAMFAQLLIAGNETTTKMLTFAAQLLAARPQLADSLRCRPELVPGFIEEVLRLESPIQGFWREVVRDTELGGVRIPAQSRVLLLYGSGNRDASVFPDPDDLVLERPGARSHLAFGFGTHFCLGAHLARTEGRIATERILATLDDLALAPGNVFPPEPSYLLHGLRSLHLTFRRRDAPVPSR